MPVLPTMMTECHPKYARGARQVLARLPWLRSLNLVANPLAAAPGYLAALHSLAPGLQACAPHRDVLCSFHWITHRSR